MPDVLINVEKYTALRSTSRTWIVSQHQKLQDRDVVSKSLYWTRQFERLREELLRSLAPCNKKCLVLKKNIDNTVQNFIARLMPLKNQTARSHRSSVKKSVKSSSSSGSSDGGDPDPDRVPKTSHPHYIHFLLFVLLSLSAAFSPISIMRVAK